MSSDPGSGPDGSERRPGEPTRPGAATADRASVERASFEEQFDTGSRVGEDRIPGEPSREIAGETVGAELRSYLIGLGLSIILTAAAFLSIGTHLIYGPGIVMAVVVFGLAQVGIHLVFFLHMTTSPDNTNNALALAFGFLIVCLIVFGSIWIMYNMNHNMIPMQERMTLQR